MAEKICSESGLDGWRDWRWQLKHRIQSVDMVEELLGIEYPPEYKGRLEETLQVFPMSVTPYYLSLIDVTDYVNDPVYRQAVPCPDELEHIKADMEDPLHEEKDSPTECVTHRYPDRVLFLTSNTCSMYCRHCTRKRRVGDLDRQFSDQDILDAVEYIRETPQIRDVLLSGGDPLMLSDERLDWIMGMLDDIEHVEILRIGSRMPVVLPYRITPELVDMIGRHKPVWLNTQFNHPREVTRAARKALARLSDGGIPLGNQSVLLRGVNDCPRIIKALNHKLVENRVRPYYLFQCDMSRGLNHFRTPISKGIEIIENLIGHTTGFAVPRYVVDAPGGGGKIPVMPNYVITCGTNKVVLRNSEGVITTYHEPEEYKADFCDRNCGECGRNLRLDDADESKSTGIARLLDDHDKRISLTPEGNERIRRRSA